MDFTALSEYLVAIVMIACLIIGYVIKHASFLKCIPNTDIPSLLAVCGAALNAFISGPTVENIIAGALTGLASTGLHQTFKRWVDNTTSEGGQNE
jgi:flagellar motor component MotA